MRAYSSTVKLYVPKERWVGKLQSYGVLKIYKDKQQKEVWKPIERGEYIHLEPQEIVRRYNSQIRGIYNYYRLANNVSVLNKFHYIMEYSMYKTFAAKYRITMTQAKLKYTRNKCFRVPYETKSGTKYETFYNEGFKKIKYALGSYADIMPEYANKNRPKELYFRYKKRTCEMCGVQNMDIKVYQVKELAELPPSSPWGNIMLQKRRKTLVVCGECYQQIHKP